jgi:perosamine synthetase
VIPYGRQSVDDDDIAAVVAVLKGDWLTQGPQVEQFESALAERTGAGHVVAFSSGTAALHAVGIATGLGPGDVVATSGLSFVASANCARYAGATARFLDIDPTTLNLDVSRLPAGAAGVVAVHYAGLPVDLSTLSYRPRVVIEDAAHALGASTPDGPVGNCARSDACVFSFHPVKAITTGEGGAVSTNDGDLAERLRRLRNHGIERRPDEGGWCYEVTGLGFNYRITDFQAALGLSQLAKLDRFIARRRALAERYRSLLAGLPVELPPEAPDGFSHAWHLFAVRVPDRRRVYDGLIAAGVGVQVHYVPIYRHPVFAAGVDRRDFPETEKAYEALLSLPLFPDLTEPEQDTVVERLAALL